ncbi:hypothetical protein NQK81_07090 [Amycolatopsis roodepoortensis]|uniref:hypothetical protein n=1 Tax=Amycolatopsis roodepoortensis TaxID=700274 RepID=UPI000F88E35E|nr:hypothetical protein [Amycolatopsis roodepoortensis]RSN23934.1 hypothetical protein DMC63_04975 [Streptomyces sp. WAC 05977]UUV33213.1 hypothetical protein NQK81_07090 [Amycolatopsis roodepoortensis]
MGNPFDEMRPVEELVDGGATTVRAAVLRKATEAVVANARDATDCRMLLEMLGLHSERPVRTDDEAA